MNIRRFRVLHAAGATYAEIARECGVDWRTVRKYLAEDASSAPPTAPPRAGTQPKVITPFVGVIEAWLRHDITLKGSVIHERLVAGQEYSPGELRDVVGVSRKYLIPLLEFLDRRQLTERTSSGRRWRGT